MTDILSLDEGYSTTRLLTQEKPQIINTPEDKFETVLFLPEGENRKGEGGLRTKGYFKKSYDDKPLISIITVVFNGEKYLEETIQSVINQTYSNVEYIIIDGGSTDGTLDIIKKYEDKIDYWVSEKDEGISDGFNKGIKLSKGKILGIINSDDEYIKNIFETISDIFKEKDIDYLYGDMILEDEEGNIIKEIKPDLKSKSIYGGMPFGHPTLFIKRKLYDKYGYFNNNYKIAHPSCYAKKLKVNVKLLNETIKEITHLSCGEFIRSKTVEEAKRLLKYDPMTCNEIADYLGFTDPAYFSRFFKREVGVSPRTFRDTSS